MSKLYRLQVDILNMILRFMLCFSVIAFFSLEYNKDSSTVYSIFLLLPAAALSIIIGLITKRIWSYIVLQFIILVVYFVLIEDPFIKVLYCAFIIFNATIQFMASLKEMCKNIHWGFMFFLLFVYVVCKYQFPEDVVLNQFYLFFSLFFFLFFILNMYYVNFNTYFRHHDGMCQIPINQIKLSNNFFIATIISVCLAVMFLFTQFPVTRLFFYGVKLLRQLTVIIFSWIAKNDNYEVSVDPTPIPEQMPETSTVDNGTGIPENYVLHYKVGNFWYYTIKVLFALLVISVSIAIVVFIIKTCIRIYKQFYRNRASSLENEIEFISPFKAKRVKEVQSQKKSSKIFRNLFGRSNNEKIRKHFYKAVMNHSEQGLALEYLTPVELSKYVMGTEVEKSENLMEIEKEIKIAELYEKARYSGKECSSEEVELLKSMMKEARTGLKK